jgi:hypothetical protein
MSYFLGLNDFLQVERGLLLAIESGVIQVYYLPFIFILMILIPFFIVAYDILAFIGYAIFGLFIVLKFFYYYFSLALNTITFGTYEKIISFISSFLCLPQLWDSLSDFFQNLVNSSRTMFSTNIVDKGFNSLATVVFLTLLIFIIITVAVLYPSKINKDKFHITKAASGNILLFVLFLIFFGIFMYIKSKGTINSENIGPLLSPFGQANNLSTQFRILLDTLENYKNIIYVILFTIGLIAFFNYTSSETIETSTYLKGISFIFLLLGIFFAYKFDLGPYYGIGLIVALFGLLLFFLFYDKDQPTNIILTNIETGNINQTTIDNIVTGISVFVAIMVFYYALQSNSGNVFNITYERIKMMVLLFCFIVIMILVKENASADFVKKYFGPVLTITILIAVFSLLYLILLMIAPSETITNILQGPSSLLDIFNKNTVWLFLGFLVFIVIITITISTKLKEYKDFKNDNIEKLKKEKQENSKNKKLSEEEIKQKNASLDSDIKQKNLEKEKAINKQGGAITAVLITSIIWCVLIFWSKSKTKFDELPINVSKTQSISKVLMGLFSVIISCLLIAWLAISIQKSSTEDGKIRFFMNIILVLVVLTIIYRVLILETNMFNVSNNLFLTTIVDILLYIPCLFSGLYDNFMRLFSSKYADAATGTTTLFAISVIMIIGMYVIPKFKNKINLQGGKQLLLEPISTNTKTRLAGYNELNSLNFKNYRYGISSWIYLDSLPPNTNSSYEKYSSLLSYGGKPDILFNASKNKILITMKLKINNNDRSKYNILDIDETNFNDDYLRNSEIIAIVEEIENVTLQKWNNFVINCDGGTIDVFLNNELIKTSINMIPYVTIDDLTVGHDQGAFGGICNVAYYDKPVSINEMFYMYNIVKDENPPIATL